MLTSVIKPERVFQSPVHFSLQVSCTYQYTGAKYDARTASARGADASLRLRAYERRDVGKSRPHKSECTAKGCTKVFSFEKKKKWQQALVLPFVVYCTYEEQPRMSDIR